MKQLSFSIDISASLFIILISTTIFNSSCSQTDKFTIGEDFVESQTNLQIIDTFQVGLSTVLLDSLTTSGTGVALVGDYKDKVFGSVKSSSYFELGFPSYDAIADNAIYDSAVFIIGYSGYSYGDTTKLLSIGIHQLTENIVLNDDGYLYNTSTFNSSLTTLGAKLFYPGPNSEDTLVRIEVNSFGEKLFRLFASSDLDVSSSETFLKYLKGFVITSNGADNNAILGFLADDSHIFLKIYYHIETEFPKAIEISIPFGTSGKQFNKIQYDFANTDLSEIKIKNNKASSAETGNKAFFQAMVGLMPKIQFPTLQDIFWDSKWKVLEAELIIEPEITSYDFFALPEQLYLYNTNNLNNLNSVLSDASGNAIIASFSLDEIFKENTRYTFDITSFITGYLANKYFDPQNGLLVGIKGTELISTLQRLVIEGKNPPVKLKLYYLSY
jgi:hypothetical protein